MPGPPWVQSQDRARTLSNQFTHRGTSVPHWYAVPVPTVSRRTTEQVGRSPGFMRCGGRAGMAKRKNVRPDYRRERPPGANTCSRPLGCARQARRRTIWERSKETSSRKRKEKRKEVLAQACRADGMKTRASPTRRTGWITCCMKPCARAIPICRYRPRSSRASVTADAASTGKRSDSSIATRERKWNGCLCSRTLHNRQERCSR